jgi:peptide/nickel transport system permease protein
LKHPGAVLLLAIVVASVVAPEIVSERYADSDLYRRNLPPFWASSEGAGLLGTDAAGRDLLVQMLRGAKTSIFISVSVIVIAGLVGVTVGILAAMAKGTLGSLVMRWVDGFMSFPGLLTALVVLFILGPGVYKIIFVLALTTWPAYARVAYSDALQVRGTAFVLAARVSGIGGFRIARSYVLPAIVRPVTALAAVQVGGVILGESGLSFLGLGVQSPDVSLGLIISQGQAYFPSAWHSTLFPGLLIALTAASLNAWVAYVSRTLDPVAAAHARANTRRPAAPAGPTAAVNPAPATATDPATPGPREAR